MKNVFILMLGLVAGTASFARTVDHKTPETSLSITSDQRIKLVVGQENNTATVTLRDTEGHVLYNSNVSLRNGLLQTFNINELSAGTYQLAVAIGSDVVVKTFVIDDQPAQKLVAFRS
ncbi:DUF3244 domain-containing protein [Spirosoma flavum]|uniref:DUF3244 domain-containing protein n=1 Tax=Spirosoma flavum TaxID=2048557 RepID=A0ABW6AN32_9BACT